MNNLSSPDKAFEREREKVGISIGKVIDVKREIDYAGDIFLNPLD